MARQNGFAVRLLITRALEDFFSKDKFDRRVFVNAVRRAISNQSLYFQWS